MTRRGAAPWSIRWRLMRGVLATVAVAWIGTMFLALYALNQEMTEASDGQMVVIARTTLVAAETATGMAIPRIVALGDTDDAEGGAALLRLSVRNLPVPDGPWPQADRDGFADIGRWRVYRLSGEGVVIEVGQSRAMRREELLEAASAMLFLVMPMLLLLVLGVSGTLSRTLAPVERVASDLGQRKPDDLSPVEPSDFPSELRPLTKALDGYLARIEALRKTERRFAANAAHELRTPLASVRARLEQAGPDDKAALIRLLDDLARRIERLLQLARSEAGVGLGQGPADLLRVLRLLREEASRRTGAQIHFDDADLDRFMVAHDPDALAILLRNLIDNAVDHGSGPVRIVLSPSGRLIIENPTAQTAFHDGAFSKGPTSPGQGLGLSIVESLSTSMGIAVSKRLSNGIARVELTFAREGTPTTSQ